MYIVVLPQSRTVIIDGLPKQLDLDTLPYPAGVHSLYYDSSSRKGAIEYADPTKPLKPAHKKDLQPFIDAYQSAPAEGVVHA